MPASPETHVLVVSDHPLFRDALVAAIGPDPQFSVSGASSEDVPDADLYLVDFDLDVPDPIGVVQRMADAQCGSIVLLSRTTEDRAYELIEIGARGLTHKSCSAEEIVEALHRVADGETVIPKTLQSAISEAIRSHPTPLASLSGRELEILEHSAEGLSAVEIGHRLNLSESTIKSQLTRIYGKLEVTDRTAAVAVALRRSLIH